MSVDVNEAVTRVEASEKGEEDKEDKEDEMTKEEAARDKKTGR